MNKILFYTMGLSKGGAERVITNLANHFISNYNITIVTNDKCKSEYKLDKRIKHICIDKKNKNRVLSKLSKRRTKILYDIINNENPDVIIAFLPEPSIRILSLKKYFKDKKIIVSIRNNPKYEFPNIFKYIRNYYYKFADKIILQSDTYKLFLPNKLYDKCVTIPNYIKKEFYNIKSDKKENLIISVGRLERQKNYKLLIDSFRMLNNNYRLYIYGDGSLKNKLQKYINKYNLQDRVILKGIKNDINKEIIKGKLFVLTSKYEGMPNALLEAMSLSIPVITTNSSPVIPEVINGENGIIVENKKQLVFSMRILLNDEKKLEHIGKNAKKILDSFSEEEVLSKWNSLINNLFY